MLAHVPQLHKNLFSLFTIKEGRKLREISWKKINIKFELIDNIHFSNPLYACQKVKKNLKIDRFCKKFDVRSKVNFMVCACFVPFWLERLFRKSGIFKFLAKANRLWERCETDKASSYDYLRTFYQKTKQKEIFFSS